MQENIGFERIPSAERQDEYENQEAASPVESPESLDVLAENERQEISRVREKIATQTVNDLRQSEKYVLSVQEQTAISEEISSLKKDVPLTKTPIFHGNKTATEYDSTAENFSTITRIITLPDGRKLFAIYNYPNSWIHRAMDTFMKKMTNCPMHKASSSDWKQQFERKSNMQTIINEDPNLVLLPYIPNLNLFDLFAHHDQIKDFGQCDFAREMEPDDYLEIISQVTAKMNELHQKDIAWGEFILNNMIIDKDKNVHICDPEIEFDEAASLSEQKAQDLQDLLFNVGARSSDIGLDMETIISKILTGYTDQQVKAVLLKQLSKDQHFLEKIFFGYTKARLSLADSAQHAEIRAKIVKMLNENQ